MKTLPENFQIEKYGLKARLVNEGDAEFIVSLRSDPKRTEYMVTLDDDIEEQRNWIRNYKKREQQGLDYYFIFSSKEDEPIGVVRASKIDLVNKTVKGNSTIVVEGLKYEALKMLIIRNELLFNVLGLDLIYADVHKDNSRILRILDLFGYTVKEDDGDYYYVSVTKQEFFKACENEIIDKFKNN